MIGTAGLSCEIRFLERGADVNRAYGSFFCYLIRNMILTTSVAAAIRSESFSKSVTHITPTKGGNRHSPVDGFIIAHRFVIIKYKGAVAGS